MSDDRRRTFSGSGQYPAFGSSPLETGGGQAVRDPRAPVFVPVRYRYTSFIHFIETQSMNISRSGMFITSNDPIPPIGTTIDFEFALEDGFQILKGKGDVVRVSSRPPGMGLRFRELDDASQKLIERIVQVNVQEGKRPAIPLEFLDAGPGSQLKGLKGATAVSQGVRFFDRDIVIEINPVTAGYFMNNPLLNIRLGGFVLPSSDEVPLGTVFGVTIQDMAARVLWSGKGKVVAKHEMRLGIRLADVNKETLSQLQSEIARAAPGGK